MLTHSGPSSIREEFCEAIRFAEFAVIEAWPPRANILDDKMVLLTPRAEPIWIGGTEDNQRRTSATRGEVAWAGIVAEEKIDASENVNQLVNGECWQYLIAQRGETRTVTVKIADECEVEIELGA